jgi:hypothetical protein
MALAQNRQVIQWNRTENSEINPHSHSHLIFNEDAKKYIAEKRASSKTVLGKLGIHK